MPKTNATTGVRRLCLWTDTERRIAALEVDGRLERLDAARICANLPGPGDIYWARVTRPAPHLNGAFLDLGAHGEGFLALGSAPPLAAGVDLIAQIDRAAEGGKRPRATLDIALRGRLAVATPARSGVSYSRSLKGGSRRADLAAALGGWLPDLGLMIRTAAADADPASVAADAARLAELWTRIQAAATRAPRRLRRGEDPVRRALLDWTDPAPDVIMLSAAAPTPDDANGLTAAIRAHMPDWSGRLVCDLEAPLPNIDDLARPDAPLPSGGRLWVEPTRALIAVDVDTGAAAGPAAKLKANLEAVTALARRLTLLRLGGLIAVDVAGRPEPDDRARIEQAFKAVFYGAAGRPLGWAPGDVFMLTRRRDGPPLDLTVLEDV